MTDYRNYIPISLKSILFLKFEQSRPHIPSPFTCHLHQLQSSMSLKSSLLLLIRHEDLLLFYHLRLKSSWRRSYDNHHRWNQRGDSTCQAPRIALHQLRNGLAKVSILPSPSKPPVVPEKERDNATTNDTEFTTAKQIVAKVQVWEEAPEDHVGLSPRLSTTLGIHGLGDISR